MFNGIEWGSYWKVMLIAGGIYYLVIFLLLFRTALSQRLHPKLAGASPEPDGVTGPGSKLRLEIKAFIEQAGQQNSGKEELLYGLRCLLHSSSVEPEDKEGITKVIIKECEVYCSVHLSEEDLRVLW